MIQTQGSKNQQSTEKTADQLMQNTDKYARKDKELRKSANERAITANDKKEQSLERTRVAEFIRRRSRINLSRFDQN